MRGISCLRSFLDRLTAPVGLRVCFGFQVRDLEQRLELADAAQQRDIPIVDILLKALIGTTPRTLRILQIGANDGLQDDFLRPYLQGNCLEALLVEPQPSAFERLRSLYENHPSVHLMNCAITDRGQDIELFAFEDPSENGVVLDVLSSFDRGHVEQWRARLGVQSKIIKKVCHGRTVAQVLADVAWQKADIVVIDTEGYDLEILKSMQPIEQLPDLLIFEFVNLSHDARLEAISLAHTLGYQTSLVERDVVCVAEKSEFLASLLPESAGVA